MVYFGFVEYRRGYALAFSLILINLVADIVYLVFPVTTDIYRAQLLAHPLDGNPFAAAMYAHFAADPSFDCFPSLHAAVAIICFYAWYRYARSAQPDHARHRHRDARRGDRCHPLHAVRQAALHRR